jgi:hypothetical protein
MVIKRIRASAGIATHACANAGQQPQTIIPYGAGAYSLPLIRCRKLAEAGSNALVNAHPCAAALFSFVYIPGLSDLQTMLRYPLISNCFFSSGFEGHSKELVDSGLMQQSW